jgi:uncharacterized protein (UPF0216 family)
MITGSIQDINRHAQQQRAALEPLCKELAHVIVASGP